MNRVVVQGEWGILERKGGVGGFWTCELFRACLSVTIVGLLGMLPLFSAAASDVYKRQLLAFAVGADAAAAAFCRCR